MRSSSHSTHCMQLQVPLLLGRARFCLSAAHTREMLEHALEQQSLPPMAPLEPPASPPREQRSSPAKSPAPPTPQSSSAVSAHAILGEGALATCGGPSRSLACVLADPPSVVALPLEGAGEVHVALERRAVLQ